MSNLDPSTTKPLLVLSSRSNGLAASKWAQQTLGTLPSMRLKDNTISRSCSIGCKSTPPAIKVLPISATLNMEGLVLPHSRLLRDKEQCVEPRRTEHPTICRPKQTSQGGNCSKSDEVLTQSLPDNHYSQTLCLRTTTEWVPPHLRWISSAAHCSTNTTPGLEEMRSEHSGGTRKVCNSIESPGLTFSKQIRQSFSAATPVGEGAVSNFAEIKSHPGSTQEELNHNDIVGEAWQAVNGNKVTEMVDDHSDCSIHTKTTKAVSPESRAPPIPYSTKPKHKPANKKEQSLVESVETMTVQRELSCNECHDDKVPWSKEEFFGHPAAIHAAIMQDISLLCDSKAIQPLTREALVQTTGGAPPESVKSGLSIAISDDGIENGEEVNNQPVGDSRAWMAPLANDLLDWTGGWAPVPASWENDRSRFSNNFIPEYIKSWRKQLPEKILSVNILQKEFLGGSPVVHGRFIAPIEHPITYPDVKNSDNIVAQRNMTSEMSGRMQSKKVLRAKRHRDQGNLAETERIEFITTCVPESNPNAPTIAIYLRPAAEKDIPGITAIYNYYVEHSIITEDHIKVTSDDVYHMWKTAQDDSLPFVVAVKGSMPKNYRFDSLEIIVGFAIADGYYGIRNTIGGRSRFTASIRFYTHCEHLRKGIARCLLDRLLQCMSSNHGAKDGYEWTNPDNNKVYDNLGGSKRYHQIQIELPVELQNDQTYKWLKDWLESKFYFKQVARFLSISRSTTAGGPARWLDVVCFQLEASSSAEFDTCV